MLGNWAEITEGKHNNFSSSKFKCILPQSILMISDTPNSLDWSVVPLDTLVPFNLTEGLELETWNYTGSGASLYIKIYTDDQINPTIKNSNYSNDPSKNAYVGMFLIRLNSRPKYKLEPCQGHAMHHLTLPQVHGLPKTWMLTRRSWGGVVEVKYGGRSVVKELNCWGEEVKWITVGGDGPISWRKPGWIPINDGMFVYLYE